MLHTHGAQDVTLCCHILKFYLFTLLWIFVHMDTVKTLRILCDKPIATNSQRIKPMRS